MSKSLIKANSVTFGKEKKRVIDSNQAVFDRLQMLNEILESSADYTEYADDFSEGLDARNVDGLFEDQDEEYSDAEVTEADIEGMLAQVNEQAESIIADANRQAEAIMSEASANAERIMEDARQDGYAKGQEEGYEYGLSKVQAMEEEINIRKSQLEADYEQRISDLEPRFVELMTDIYSHVFNVDLSDKSELVLYLLKDAIRNIDGTHYYFIHVSKDDYEFVVQNKDELTAGLPGSCTVEIIEDISLSKGGCFIEGESGIFDCSLGTQLQLLKKELMLISYTPSETGE